MAKLSFVLGILVGASSASLSAPNSAHYAPIGVITGGQSVGRGPGFLVDRCHVLSVKHVAGHTDSVLGRRLHFRVPTSKSQSLASAGTVVAAGNLDVKRNLLSQDRFGDWMLLKLDTCLGAIVGFVEINSSAVTSSSLALSGNSFQSAGFRNRWDWRQGPAFDRSCMIKVISPRQLWNDCDVRPGDSGGPLFDSVIVGGKTKYRVLGIQSAETIPDPVYGSVIAVRIDAIYSSIAPILERS